MLQYLTKEQLNVHLRSFESLFTSKTAYLCSLCGCFWRATLCNMVTCFLLIKISLLLLYAAEPQASDFAALSHKHDIDVYH